MKLRKLMEQDAPLMLEWMHDDNVTEFLGANFAEKTIEDAKNFIAYANREGIDDLHLAIVDDKDEYMGTVSLKHLDETRKTAEFAISTRTTSMGKGNASQAMKMILSMGMEQYGLDAIYWCVSRKNERAVRFYDKNGYQRTTDVPKHILDVYSESQLASFLWYVYR